MLLCIYHMTYCVEVSIPTKISMPVFYNTVTPIYFGPYSYSYSVVVACYYKAHCYVHTTHNINISISYER